MLTIIKNRPTIAFMSLHWPTEHPPLDQKEQTAGNAGFKLKKGEHKQ
jgi:hypothetical protein